MSKNIHLTRDQLSALSGVPFSAIESGTAQKHLMMCDKCRKQLPLPSVEQLWAAVLMQNELDENANGEKSEPIWSPVLAGFSFVWNLRSGLVWTAGAFVVLLGLIFLLRMDVAESKEEIVQILDSQKELGPEINYSPSNPVPGNLNQTASNNTNHVNNGHDPRRLRTDLPAPKRLQNNLGQSSSKNRVKDKPLRVSETRGGSSDCTGEQTFEIEVSSMQENYVFKWKKLPKAIKYHIYISDDDEILIDEYETENETFFVMRKQLDPLKTYKWKVIITLENGQTVISSSSKFTINDFQTSRLKPEKKKNADIRCSSND